MWYLIRWLFGLSDPDHDRLEQCRREGHQAQLAREGKLEGWTYQTLPPCQICEERHQKEKAEKAKKAHRAWTRT